jgi:hypothetical protein
MKRFITIILTLAALVLANGCFDPFHSNPYFEVEDSGLDWLEIYNKEVPGKRLVRVRIDGSGIVKIREGTSPLVGDEFAKDNTHEHWEDIRDYQITIPRDEALRIFQGLVNNGLFLEQKKKEDSPENDVIMAFGNIKNHTVYATIYEPVLHEHLKSLVLLFNRPRQKRRSP